MKRIFRDFASVFAVLAALAWTMPATAAEKDAEDEGYSAYSVARLKVFEGTAWIRMPDSGEWEEYSTNTPVPERARVNIPEKSEAELQFHGGQFVLLTEGTEVDVRKFDEGGTTFRLRSGEIRFDLPADDFSPVNVTIPGGKTNFSVPGRYWLKIGEDGQTHMVVRTGEAEVAAERGNYRVTAGQEASIGKDVRIAAYQGSAEDKYEAPPPLTEEEQRADVPPAAAQELREYGEWVSSSDYGYVWRPRVVTGWSPYYYGRWTWISPYGWTWVSYEPWGWYPYHFGWWVNDPFLGWCWSPYRSFVSVGFVFGSGRFTHFHRNAFFFPANVRFVRDGGFVRWVPLRPGERFVRPGFTRSNARLAAWERPIPRGTVFTRNARDGRKAEWRSWSDTRRARGKVVVRETDARRGGNEVRREVPQVRDARPEPRPKAERARPEGQERMQQRGPDRQERMQQRGPDRQERPQREFRGRDGRSGDRSLGPGRGMTERGPAVRSDGARTPRVQAVPRVSPERVRAPRTTAEPRIRPEGMRPPSRVERPARESRPRVVAPPPYRAEERRGAPAFRAESPAPSHSPPQRSFAPDRGPAPSPPMRNPDRGPGPNPSMRNFDGGRGGADRGAADRGGGGGRR